MTPFTVNSRNVYECIIDTLNTIFWRFFDKFFALHRSLYYCCQKLFFLDTLACFISHSFFLSFYLISCRLLYLYFTSLSSTLLYFRLIFHSPNLCYFLIITTCCLSWRWWNRTSSLLVLLSIMHFRTYRASKYNLIVLPLFSRAYPFYFIFAYCILFERKDVLLLSN